MLRPKPGAKPKQQLTALIVLAAVTLATRAWIIGRSVTFIDDQFYLLVGQRMLEGALPYVDIWDRKPIGLFLIYALAYRVFADPVVGYLLLAALSVLLTSFLLFTVARQVTSFRSALAGAAAYPVWLLVFDGQGGQSPVFYNLPMTAAAALTLHGISSGSGRRLFTCGCAAMILAGIAIQIKYTAVFEGVFFGLSLLWAGRKFGRGLARQGMDAAAWIGLALAPTCAALAVYWQMGHGGEFIEANFLSVFKDEHLLEPAIWRLTGLLIGISPIVVTAWLVLRRRQPNEAPRPLNETWMIAWAGASIAGFIFYGVWYDHYVLAVLPPLCLLGALAFDRTARLWPVAAAIFGLGLPGGFGRAALDVASRGSTRELSHLVAKVTPRLNGGCLYVNATLPILYLLTHSCLPSRFAFPAHLTENTFRRALGVDQADEIRRVMARRPTVVVRRTTPDEDSRPALTETFEAELRKSYRLVDQTTVGADRYEIYVPSGPPRATTQPIRPAG